MDYRGLIILIPLYLKPIEALLNPDHCYTDSEKNAALSLLGSIITISSYYNDYTFTSLANEESITMIYIKDEAYKYILYVLLKYKTSQSSSHSHLKVIMKAICCATVIIYQEALKPSLNIDIINVISDAS